MGIRPEELIDGVEIGEIEVENEVESFKVQPIESVRQVIVLGHLLHLACSFGRISAGAVDQIVDLTQLLMDEVPCLEQGLLVKGAGRDPETLDPELPCNSLPLLRIVFGTADDSQVHTGFRQSSRKRHPNHPESSGDDAIPAFKVVE